MSNEDDSRDPNEELVHEDDAIIGKAFRWSAMIFGGVALLIGIVVLVLRKPVEKPLEQKTEIVAAVSREKSESLVPEVRFTDVTEAAGIGFVHNNGATGEKLLPESLGGGVAFLDYDNDGDQDLLFVNSTWWPWDLEKDPARTPTTAGLYRNDTEPGGEVRFTDVTIGSGLDVPVFGMGLAVGDIDNDGLVDVYITCVGENRLFRNLGGGKFEDTGSAAGVAGDESDWSTAAAFFDFDNDGLLDLFVANYVQWSRKIDFDVNFTIDGTHRAYGPPTDFMGAFPRLYRNAGNATFEDVSEASGVQKTNRSTGSPMAKSLGVAVVDINEDGWMDFIVANDTVPNLLFLNQQDGTFSERGALTGIAYDSMGRARGAMGIDIAHHRNNADLGIAIGNFANEMTALFVSQGSNDLFADEAIGEGIGPASRLPLKFGIFFFDYDLDGWQDLLSVNGHLDEDITRLQKSQTYAQAAQLFWNDRGFGFVEVPGEKGGDLFSPLVGRGSAYADIDSDGDLDVVFTQLHGRPALLRNDLQGENRSLRLKLVGSKSNRDAIGAVVQLHQVSAVQRRRVVASRSYLSQSELPVTFGIDAAMGVERLEVLWPSGATTTLGAQDLEYDGLMTVREPSGD